MLGLPKSTELTQALPKTRIFAKFDLKSAQKESFDADVSRMSIVNVISPRTIPALPAGDTKESIYVVEVILKRQNYAPKNIQLLCKLLDIDAVWDNLVKKVGDVKVEEGNTLEEQIHYDEARAKLLNQIEVLEKKARSEKQPRRKYEMYQEILRLKEKI